MKWCSCIVKRRLLSATGRQADEKSARKAACLRRQAKTQSNRKEIKTIEQCFWEDKIMQFRRIAFILKLIVLASFWGCNNKPLDFKMEVI